jgi:hypothetical protein
LSDQSNPDFAKIAKTAREYAVPVGGLRRRWNGSKSLFQRQPNGRKLSIAQEAALSSYIYYFDKAGASVNWSQIATASNSILAEAHTDIITKLPQLANIGENVSLKEILGITDLAGEPSILTQNAHLINKRQRPGSKTTYASSFCHLVSECFYHHILRLSIIAPNLWLCQ